MNAETTQEFSTKPESRKKSSAINNIRAQNDEIDLKEIFYLLWGKAWLILLAMILGGILAFGGTYFFVTPTYKATSEIYLVSASSDSVIDLSDLQISSNLATDYLLLMTNRPLLEDVIESQKLDMTTGQLKSMISLENPDSSRIIKITVTDTDPKRAAAIANEIANQAIIYLPEIMETKQAPHMVESALVPSGKSSPSYSKNTIMGAVLGALFVIVILIVPYLMNDTIVTPDDMVKNFGIYPLATIPEANQGRKTKSRVNQTSMKGKERKETRK